MTLEAIPTPYFLIFEINIKNMADTRTCEMGVTLDLLRALK
jgi:hypothetical protein